MEKRIFISAPSNYRLDDRQRGLKRAILDKIRQSGYVPQEFRESGVPENLAWSFDNVDRVTRMCRGALVLAIPRWKVADASEELKLVGE
jgi:hypothetical protein